MSGRHTAAVAYVMVEDMIARLAAAGTPPERMPGIDDALKIVWPCARQLARLERTVGQAFATAGNAREATIALAVAKWAPPARTEQAGQAGHLAGTPETLAPGVAGTEKFHAERWSVALVRRPSGDRDRSRDREVA
jgi:hypothetical protein